MNGCGEGTAFAAQLPKAFPAMTIKPNLQSIFP